VNERGLLLECSMWKKSDFDDDDEIKDDADAVVAEIDDEVGSEYCGKLLLNMDHWDESKEKGRLFLFRYQNRLTKILQPMRHHLRPRTIMMPM